MSIASEPKHCPQCQAPLPGDAPQGLCPKCLLAAAAIPTEAGQPAPDKTPPSLAELAAAFPQLEILELIGQGGMGFVFKARQPKLDRFVALKILPQSLAADPAFAERFSREGRVLAKLNHPNIVTVHDFGVAAGILPAVEPGFQPGGKDVESSTGLEHSEAIAVSSAHPGGRMPPSTPGKIPDARTQTQFYYLLMEFVDGVNLRQAMRAGRFTPDQALAIVPKICEALQFAHNEGILHRDIKPENILLDAKGRVKIADFGIAKLVAAVCDRRDSAEDDWRRSQTAATENLTEAGKALGTPNYMAPEQREGSGEVDHRADIYSLGVVFYEMLTGELPLGRFAPPSQKSSADPRVDEVVLRALEKEKAKRYASAEEVKTQVETIAATPDSSRRRGDESQTEKPEIGIRKSQMVRLVELLSGITFTSRRAVFLVSLSALGFLGFLSCLSYLPFLAAHYFKAFSGAFGLFGLIGVAFAFEFRTRLKKSCVTSPDSSQREEAQTESERQKAETGQSLVASVATNQEPRFSPTALFGAVLGATFVMTGITFHFMLANGQVFPGLVMLLLTACGMTLCGWIAVSQIRRSAGKLYGLWLAVFDGLLFPLLAADLVIARLGAFVWNASCSSLGWDYHDLTIAIDGILIALVCAAVDFLAIRAVWRAVNAGGADGAPSGQTRNGRMAIICLAAVMAVVALAAALIQTTGTPLAVTCQTIQKEVGRQLRETGASYDSLQVIVAEPRDSGTPFTVSYRGLRNFKYTHYGQPDPRWPASASGQFIMEYIGGGQWQGKLGDRQFTVQAGRTDNIDQPFVDDPQILGTWETVNFVDAQSDFVPDAPKPKFLSNPCFNDVTFLAGGKTLSWWRWTKGVVLHQGDKTASHYEMQNIKGELYLFVEWKSGDVVLLGMKPKYWVLKKSSFGPVIERGISGEGDANKRFIDFDSGKQFAAAEFFGPKDEPSPEETQRLWRKTGIDAAGDTSPEVCGLVGFEMAAVPLTTKEWDQTNPHILDSSYLAVAKPGTPAIMSGRGELPATFAFKTREGGRGLLQITGFTETPRGVNIRYKLVPPTKAATPKSDPAPTSPMIYRWNSDVERRTPTADEIAEPPKLRFLVWQDEWETQKSDAARHPDGSPVTNAEELKWLKVVDAGGMNTTYESHPRFLKLWISHPAFKRTDYTGITLLDADGHPLKRGANGESSCSLVEASEQNGGQGWRCWNGSPVEGTNLPEHLTVQLSYVVGPLEKTQEVRPDFNGTMSLEGNSILNGMGENAQGWASLSIAVNAQAVKSRLFGVVAVTKDGRELREIGGGRPGYDTAIDTDKFEFPVPLTAVAKFIIGTRPIRTNEWRNVVLPKPSSHG